MNKKSFFSGLSAKLALAVVALAGATFTSCDEENLNVEVKQNPAEVNIMPYVTYVDVEAGTATDVTSQSTIEFAGANKSGNMGVIKGTEASPAIAATTVTVTATYNGKSGSVTVNVAAISSGKIVYDAPITIVADKPVNPDDPNNPDNPDDPNNPDNPDDPNNPDNPDDPNNPETATYEVVLGDAVTTSNAIKYASALTHNGVSHSGISHDGGTWFENAKPYFLAVSYDFDWTVTKVIEKASDDLTPYKSELLTAGVIETTYSRTGTCTETVSAWALYRPTLKTTNTTTPGQVINKTTGETVATFNYVVYNNTATASIEEKAHPSHAGHYHSGHGDGTENAGGGVIFGD